MRERAMNDTGSSGLLPSVSEPAWTGIDVVEGMKR